MRESVYYLTKKQVQIRHLVSTEADLAHEMFIAHQGSDSALYAYELWCEALVTLDEYIDLLNSDEKVKKKVKRAARRDLVDSIVDALEASNIARRENCSVIVTLALNLETRLRLEWQVFKAVPSLYRKRTKKNVSL